LTLKKSDFWKIFIEKKNTEREKKMVVGEKGVSRVPRPKIPTTFPTLAMALLATCSIG